MTDREMLEAMAQLLQPINERLDKIEKAQSQTTCRLDKMDGWLDKIEEDTRHTRVLLEATNKNMSLLCEAQQETYAKLRQLDRMEITLNNVKSDTEVLKDVVSWHSQDIKSLKQA